MTSTRLGRCWVGDACILSLTTCLCAHCSYSESYVFSIIISLVLLPVSMHCAPVAYK